MWDTTLGANKWDAALDTQWMIRNPIEVLIIRMHAIYITLIFDNIFVKWICCDVICFNRMLETGEYLLK